MKHETVSFDLYEIFETYDNEKMFFGCKKTVKHSVPTKSISE